jgi:hypothetical protein
LHPRQHPLPIRRNDPCKLYAASFTLQAKHVRLEPLEHRNVEGLVAAAGDDAASLPLESVPCGKVEATAYVETALAWRWQDFDLARCEVKTKEAL